MLSSIADGFIAASSGALIKFALAVVFGKHTTT
jgi:hypothetical protein